MSSLFSSHHANTVQSAQPKNMASQNSNVFPFANKVYNLAFSAPPSSPAHATLMPTHQTTTPNFVRTTSLSSSAADTLSNVAEPCKWKWSPEANSSSTSSLRCQITWMMFPRPERRHDARLTWVAVAYSTTRPRNGMRVRPHLNVAKQRDSSPLFPNSLICKPTTSVPTHLIYLGLKKSCSSFLYPRVPR